MSIFENPKLFVAVILLVVAVVFSGIGLSFRHYLRVKRKRCCGIAAGTVLRTGRFSGPTIRYVVDERVITKKMQLKRLPMPMKRKGENVTVLYNPDDPADMILMGYQDHINHIFATAFTSVGLIAVLVAIILFASVYGAGAIDTRNNY